MIKYAKTHEWIRIENDDIAVVGITDFAVGQLSDLVFLELPKVGADLAKGSPFGTIESVKAVFDLNSPVSGKVTGVNESLINDLGLLQRDPNAGGWIMKVKISDRSELTGLMDEDAYRKYIKEGGH